jgi:hypothetical protein
VNLRDALIQQPPSLALQRAAQAEVARLDGAHRALFDCLTRLAQAVDLGGPVAAQAQRAALDALAQHPPVAR